MGAIADYGALVEAVDSQKRRLQGPPQPDLWGGDIAKRFRADPKRQMEDSFEALAELVRPDDVFVDAGGGAGRFSLPMALRCRQAINVDPSAGMGQEFEKSAAEAVSSAPTTQHTPVWGQGSAANNKFVSFDLCD